MPDTKFDAERPDAIAQTAPGGGDWLVAAIMRQMPASIVVLGAPDGHVLMHSDLAASTYGERLDAIRTWRDVAGLGISHPDGRPYEAEDYPVVRALLHGESFLGEPFCRREPDGRLRWSETWTAPVRDADGRIVAAVGSAVDVTARRETELALAASEERFRALSESLPQLVWTTRPDGQCDYLSPQWQAYTGAPAERHLADGWLDALHPDDRERASAAFRACMDNLDAYDIEYRLRRHDGVYRWFKARAAPVRDASGRIARWFGTTTDIHDLKSAETALRDTETQLRAALEAREILVREADHRIRNSLQLVGSLIGLQRGKLVDPEAIQALDDAAARVRAVGEAHRALEQSSNLQTMAFGRLLHSLCRFGSALNPMVAFGCDADEAMELDAERAIPVGLIVSELLTNVAKYAFPPGEAGEARVRAAIDNALVTVSVSDSGSGYSDARLDKPSLGTTVIRALARQIGATLDIVSAPGDGTTATLTLTLHPRAGDAG